ncbi:MAG: arginine--tRNA ligase [bacterium]
MRESIINALYLSIKNFLKQDYPSFPFHDIPINLEATKNQQHGDVTSNIAFLLGKRLKKRPIDIAKEIVKQFQIESNIIERISVAEPGFINFSLSNQYWQKVIDSVIDKADSYGHSDLGQKKRVLIEFVSANPTGPLHIGHGRCAAFGDTLSNLLSATGYNVQNEYYINDAGRQMALLGESILARYKQIFAPEASFPEDGYKGDYIKEMAQRIYEESGDSLLSRPQKGINQYLSQMASAQILDNIRKDLAAFGVHFDNWFSENSLYESNKVSYVLDLLRNKGLIYEKDGAQWMNASLLGDQKDRVIIRSNGEPTYFASDIAYHQNKYERGYEKLIDIWGADHHGYVDRVRAVLKALRHPDESFSVLLVQMVKLVRHGIQIDMSTRRGTFTTLEEVIEEVGTDVARFFFLLRRHDSHLDFDLDLAKEKSSDNPVYYCQYAHARICSIEKKAINRGFDVAKIEADTSLLTLDEERELIKKLDTYPSVINNASQALEPHRLTFFLIELSTLFHKYYNAHRVITKKHQTTMARIKLTRAIKIVLKNCLALLGVSAPEKM